MLLYLVLLLENVFSTSVHNICIILLTYMYFCFVTMSCICLSLINFCSVLFIFNLYNLLLAHYDFCRLLITLASSLNPNQDRHFVSSQFDTDVNTIGTDQTVARGDFCRLLISLANRLTTFRTSSVDPNSLTLL